MALPKALQTSPATIKPVKLVKTKRAVFKRIGAITQTEKELVAAVVMDQPREMSVVQVNSLAKALRRSREQMRELVENARDNFVCRAERYVDIHLETAEAALANGDAKSLEVASRSAQWAMENMASDGVRIVDKPTKEDTSPKVYVGIKIGGLNEAPVVVSKRE